MEVDMGKSRMDNRAATDTEPQYEVVWPLGKSVSPPVALAPALPDLNNLSVGEFWGWVYRGDQMFPVINDELRKKYPGIKIVDHETTGDSHANNIMERDYVAALPSLFRQHGCNAVIVGVGA
jgi:hypothetical protein